MDGRGAAALSPRHDPACPLEFSTDVAPQTTLRSNDLCADGVSVFRTHPNARELKRHVTELPVEFQVWRIDDHWSVVGPSGIFVVGRSTGDATEAAAQTAALAHELRAALSETMSWVPFVDAFVVADREHQGLACTVVEMNMLAHALASGVGMLDATATAQVSREMPRAIRSVQDPTHRPLDLA